MRRVLALAAVLTAATLVASAFGSQAGVWKALHRPLHVPQLAAGASCPVSPVNRRINFARYGVGRGLGAGPAFPVLAAATLPVEFPAPVNSPFEGSAWSGAKITWFVSPAYRGPLLVRGRRLDGADPVRFGTARNPAAELRIPVGAGQGAPVRSVKDVGQRYLSAYTRVRAPGCYAWQIDGTTFSRVIVFRVPGDLWTPLRRPLDLPAVGSGAACPVSGVDRSFDFAQYGVGAGIGPGPVWPIGLAQPGSVLRFQYPPPATSLMAGSEWSGNKVLWFVSPAVAGPVLVRGGRLDAAGEVRFGLERVPPTELHLLSRLDNPSTTRVREPGCYAYQVDGAAFSYPIVFRAETTP